MIKLTQYSKSAGCGCKIAPAMLQEILKGLSANNHPGLLVGYETSDDAAVYDIGNDQCVISTTDFFMPIVDNAEDFGSIAACNALSDVYAMGGQPIMAVAILGWPTDKLPLGLARRTLQGAQKICQEAGIPLAGGHSVDSQEPIFGLAVTGMVNKTQLKRNNTIQEGDILFLSKPLGTGVLSTALKRSVLKDEQYTTLVNTMTRLNNMGNWLGTLPYVNAMTDITGFGLTGHLLEMLKNDTCSAILEKDAIPVLDGVFDYVQQFIFPDNTTRNFNASADFVDGMQDLDFILYCDPQTSGGLLVSVSPNKLFEFEGAMAELGHNMTRIGQIVSRREKKIYFI